MRTETHNSGQGLTVLEKVDDVIETVEAVMDRHGYKAAPQSKFGFDEPMMLYMEYAAAIEGKTVEKLEAKVKRQFRALDPSLKKLETVDTFARRTIVDVILTHEIQNRLPKSTSYSNRSSAAHRCWENMLRNRTALACA